VKIIYLSDKPRLKFKINYIPILSRYCTKISEYVTINLRTCDNEVRIEYGVVTFSVSFKIK